MVLSGLTLAGSRRMTYKYFAGVTFDPKLRDAGVHTAREISNGEGTEGIRISRYLEFCDSIDICDVSKASFGCEVGQKE